MVDHFAFYGTLMDVNVGDAMSRVGECLIPGVLFDVGPFPALVEGTDSCYGVLWQVAPGYGDSCLEAFDQIESYLEWDEDRSMYLRRIREVLITETDEIVPAWTYYWNGRPDGLTRVPNGRWQQTEYRYAYQRSAV